MDGPIQNDFQMSTNVLQNVFPNILNGWPHTECFHVLHGWPHTCFSKHTKWMAPYRMIIEMYYMDGPIQNVFPNILNDGPIHNVFPNILNGWPHTECFSIHITWVAPYRMIFHTY